jgi:hypothetical protein
MWQAIATWWIGLPATVQGAIVSGCFTIVTAAVALFVVRIQLVGQADNAAWNNRHPVPGCTKITAGCDFATPSAFPNVPGASKGILLKLVLI